MFVAFSQYLNFTVFQKEKLKYHWKKTNKWVTALIDKDYNWIKSILKRKFYDPHSTFWDHSKTLAYFNDF